MAEFVLLRLESRKSLRHRVKARRRSNVISLVLLGASSGSLAFCSYFGNRDLLAFAETRIIGSQVPVNT